MANSTWMSAITERSENFSEEAALAIRRKMRAISLLAGLPILCMLNNFQYSKSLLWSQGSNSNCSSSSTDSSGEGEHIKEEEDDPNHDKVQCVICLCNVCKGEKYRVLEECSHGFHVDCIDAWLMQNSTCPLCRCSVAYAPAGTKQLQQQPSSQDEDQDAYYYEVVIASILSFLDHLWAWFLNPLGFDPSCQDYSAYL